MSLEKFQGKDWAVSFKKGIQWAIGKEFLGFEQYTDVSLGNINSYELRKL